ncbi:MAG: RecX family transcriptional regulator [Oscillospiraceae bacterium]|nr:RecX family transcriptional regulator [Oscillospiraceae bacterium]
MMVITEISLFKGSTMCVVFDDKSRIYINSSIVSEYNLKAGMSIPAAAVEEIADANDFRRARERALYLLDGRDYSFVELYKKLETNYSEDICLRVCKNMAEMRLINDRRYAEMRARELFEVKGVGMYKARQELKRRGLSDKIIDEAVEPYSDEEESFSRLEELVERKYERYLVDEKGVKKVKNALFRQGYSYSEINAVLDLYDLDFGEE